MVFFQPGSEMILGWEKRWRHWVQHEFSTRKFSAITFLHAINCRNNKINRISTQSLPIYLASHRK
jgi:hypothetical protein